MPDRRGILSHRKENRIAVVVDRIRQHMHIRVVGSYAISQGVVFLTSLARIPLVIAAIGSDGYGVALAITSLQAWIVIVILSVTHLTQVSVSEDLGREDSLGALHTVMKMRRRAWQLSLTILLVGIVLSVALPWTRLSCRESDRSRSPYRGDLRQPVVIGERCPWRRLSRLIKC